MKGMCYRCGAIDELIDGLCPLCYKQLNPLIEIPDRVEIEVCHMCGSYKRKTWQTPKGESPEEIVEEIVRWAVRDNLEVKGDVEIEVLPYISQLPGGKRSKLIVPVKIIAKGKLPGEKEEREEERDIEVHLKMVQCPRCSRFMSNYYEATLQVRAMNRYLTEEEKEEIDKFVREELYRRLKKDRMAFISKFIPQKEGLDYQLGSVGAARSVAQRIKQKYGGKITESATLVGVDSEGNELYRVTVSVKIPEYRVGDVVEYKDKYHVVSAITENKVYMKTLDEKREKVGVSWHIAEKETKLISKREDLSSATVISTIPKLMVMDDRSYEIYEFDTNLDVKEGDKIKILKKDERIYLVGKDDRDR
ncbi:NMD3 family protein [Methanocaldococcus infernus ME]|uniref:NMD3 family protein n=1 Tax=Methanocaldococcus infernus (strain DSM 11812 / JCM 15783 / ME) TaxID=573063 RepID=D5VRS5_METIM|nr:60S ribosomal export protein NMD3 [Methanocaldococcus infernus]ADG13278.1 NMD3 family protein [Methanocaldococcus infernus ME]